MIIPHPLHHPRLQSVSCALVAPSLCRLLVESQLLEFLDVSFSWPRLLMELLELLLEFLELLGEFLEVWLPGDPLRLDDHHRQKVAALAQFLIEGRQLSYL